MKLNALFLLANALCGLSALAMDSAPLVPSSSKYDSGQSFAQNRIRKIIKNEKSFLALAHLSQQRHFSESVRFLSIYLFNEDKIETEYEKYLDTKVSIDNLVYELFVLAGINQDRIEIAPRSETANLKLSKEFLLQLSEEPIISLSSMERNKLQKIVSERAKFAIYKIEIDKIVESQCQLVSNNLNLGWEESIPQDIHRDSKISCFGGCMAIRVAK
jgi:hypothetical protein